MFERVITAIENYETIMIDVEIDDNMCFHMEFIPEEITMTDTVAVIYGSNGDLFEFPANKLHIGEDDFYYVEGENFVRAIIMFA